MSEELPTLPEPAGALEVDEGPAGHGYPEGARLQSSADGYTADQMLAYARQAVLMERERAARICEDYSRGLAGGAFPHSSQQCAEVAAAIRSGKQGE